MSFLFRLARLSGATLAVAACLQSGPSRAQSREDTLRYVTSGVVNTLDPVMLGATPQATALSTAVYDRLFRFGRKPAGNGSFVFDFGTLEGELAERYEISPDGLTITVRLRANAQWHDGSPVTAEDVKWSLDRAVSAQTMSKAQVATGSLTRPDQFRVVDPQTVEIRLDRPDRLALPNLATTFAPMFNSRLARQHATEADPWATGWLRQNTAAGGAYRIQSLQPGVQTEMIRNETWTNGTKPFFRRVILQTVPEAATRASLVERGDADLAIEIQAEDLKALAASPSVNVVSTPMPSGFAAVIFNTQMPPFDRAGVRQAIALALPYDAIVTAAFGGRGGKLYGADWTGEPSRSDFPQPLPHRTDVEAARRTLAEAGFPAGFETVLSYSVNRATFAEPAASLIQEALARIGVRVRIEKLSDVQMASAVTEKRLPMILERSFALFPSTEYFFRIFMSGPSRWNFASWKNAEVDALLPQARSEPDAARYDAIARRLVAIAAAEVPMAMIVQPSYDVVTARTIKGFTTWYNYYPDLRDLTRE
ncbi:MAG: transporter substrate-binding protein [Enterovirga sp.]|nr:transporter substrate-binding protein [Enterovirga sp.]